MNRFVLLLTLLVLGISAKRSLRSLLREDSNPLVREHAICSNTGSNVGAVLTASAEPVGCYSRDLKKAATADASYKAKTEKLGSDVLGQLRHQGVSATRQTTKTLAGGCPWAPSVYGPLKIAGHAVIAGKSIEKLATLSPDQLFSLLVGFIRGLFNKIIKQCVACFSTVLEALNTVVKSEDTDTKELSAGLAVKDQEAKKGSGKPKPPSKDFFGTIKALLNIVQGVMKGVEKCSAVLTSITSVIFKITTLIATAGISFAPSEECWFWHWIHRANEAMASEPATGEKCASMKKESDCVKYGSCQGICKWKAEKCAENSAVSAKVEPKGNCAFDMGFFLGTAIAEITSLNSGNSADEA